MDVCYWTIDTRQAEFRTQLWLTSCTWRIQVGWGVSIIRTWMMIIASIHRSCMRWIKSLESEQIDSIRLYSLLHSCNLHCSWSVNLNGDEQRFWLLSCATILKLIWNQKFKVMFDQCIGTWRNSASNKYSQPMMLLYNWNWSHWPN